MPAQKRNSIDLNLGLVEDHYYRAKRTTAQGTEANDASATPPMQKVQRTGTSRSHDIEHEQVSSPASSARREKPPNPLLLLIYNLLAADMTLSAAYTTGIGWLAVDGIIAPSRICAAQGWIVSFGCLTTSGVLFAISILSYLNIIRGYKPTTRDVIIASTTIWTLSVLLSSIGPMYHQSLSFYGRETTWCWISDEHRMWRVGIYLWGFPAMASTMCSYSVIFYKLWREGRSSRFMPPRRRRRQNSSATQVSSRSRASAAPGSGNTALRPSGHHPAFLIYPCIYCVTGTPLILGSLILPLERNSYFMATAGSLLAMTGLLDTILWSSIILFSKKEDLANAGLDQFSLMRTPEGRTLGNIVFVQGGSGGQGNDRRLNRQSWHTKEKGWWRLGDRNSLPTSNARMWPADYDSENQGIQMEVVTTVMVEGGDPQRRARDMSTQREPSMDSLKNCP
ncbi:unnamed protein product [Discula destructiva]